MTSFQKTVKNLAIVFAIYLTISIIGGIFSAVGVLSGLSRGDAATEDLKKYDLSSDVQSLDVEINAADFTIRHGEGFSVESNLKDLTVKTQNGVLQIKQTKRLVQNHDGGVLTLCIPADKTFEKINMITGAGRLKAARLAADTVRFEFGAGEVVIDTLIASSQIELEGGAGKITVANGTLHNLDLDMGVGKLSLTTALTGESGFDLGVGETELTVLGNRDDYELEIEKGIGKITLDGKDVSNFKDRGNGKNGIEIHGGVGNIDIKFVSPDAKQF